eukprot:jgi/Bigna1/73473/fgenesh1_pg.24_\
MARTGTDVPIAQLDVNEIRSRLKDLGLSTYGMKNELVERLQSTLRGKRGEQIMEKKEKKSTAMVVTKSPRIFPGTRNAADPVSDTERRATWTVAFLEGFLSSWEYIFGLTSFGMMAREALQGVYGGDLIAEFLATILIVSWMLWRFGSTSELPMKVILRRMGATRPAVSVYIAYVAVIHIISLALTIMLQKSTGKDGNFLAEKAADMLLLAPIREEFFFRGIMFSLIYRRLGSIRKENVWPFAVLMSGGSFALLHSMNFLNSQGHSKLYVALQVVSGFVIGSFYTLRFLSTGCLWENIVLHMVHNAFASFVPVNLQASLLDISFLLPAVATVAIHLMLARFSYQSVQKEGGFQYNVIELKTEAASRLQVFLDAESDLTTAANNRSDAEERDRGGVIVKNEEGKDRKLSKRRGRKGKYK